MCVRASVNLLGLVSLAQLSSRVCVSLTLSGGEGVYVTWPRSVPDR